MLWALRDSLCVRVEWDQADAVTFNEHRNTVNETTAAANHEHARVALCVCESVGDAAKKFAPSRGELFVDFYAYSNKHYYYYIQIMR